MAVVGTGLIGTSVALAASRQGVRVYLSDRDEAVAHAAAALGAGVVECPAESVELGVLAVPPSQVGGVFAEQRSRGLALSYTDVASVKSGPEQDVLDRDPDPSCYIGGHPLAGRELSGPLAAKADLFQGRPWVLTPSRLTSQPTFDRAVELVGLCGAIPVVMRSRAHDEAVALTSHLPHLVASLMAARLLHGPAETSQLAGQGLRDVTRIAGGDSRLWSDILQSNAVAVARVLRDLHEDLSRLLVALEDLAAPHNAAPHDAVPRNAAHGAVPYGEDRTPSMWTLTDLLERGIAGLDVIPAEYVRPRTPGVTAAVSAVDRPAR